MLLDRLEYMFAKDRIATSNLFGNESTQPAMESSSKRPHLETSAMNDHSMVSAIEDPSILPPSSSSILSTHQTAMLGQEAREQDNANLSLLNFLPRNPPNDPSIMDTNVYDPLMTNGPGVTEGFMDTNGMIMENENENESENTNENETLNNRIPVQPEINVHPNQANNNVIWVVFIHSFIHISHLTSPSQIDFRPHLQHTLDSS